MKKMYPALLFIGTLFLMFVPVRGQYIEFVQITDDDIEQTSPAIDGDYVVYRDTRSIYGPNIYLYNRVTKTEVALTSEPALRKSPDISNNRVVWADKRSGDWEIYIYDINTPHIEAHPLFVWEGHQQSPAIYGDILVFSDYKPDVDYGNIYMFDFVSGVLTRLTHDVEQGQSNPDVYGDYIVWQDQRSGNWDIYMYHIPTGIETQLTDDPADQEFPSIYGKRVVWQDNRNGDWDIYMHHITFGLATVFENFDWPLWKLGLYNSKNQTHPVIYGDHVVWQDDRNGDWDLYMFTFVNDITGDISQMFDVDYDQEYPAIYDKYVVFEDKRDNDGGIDIWQWEMPPGVNLGLVVEDDPDPVVTGNELVYTVYVKNTSEQTAHDVVVTCTLSSNVDYKYAYNSTGSGASRVDNEVYCDLGTMEYNDIDTVKVHVTPLDEGRPIFTALVETSDDDIHLENNTQSIKTNVVWALSDVIDIGANPSLFMTGNTSHMVYTDKMEGDYLKYATNKTGTWTRSTLAENHDNPIMSPQVTVDQNDTAHVVYYVYKNWTTSELYYIKETQTGWSTPLKLDEYWYEFGGVSIACSPDGIIYVSYLKSRWGDNINLQYFNGTWSGPIVIPTSPESSAYNDLSMAVDHDGHIHFAYYLMGAQNQGPHYITNAPDSVWKASELIHDGWSGGQLESLRLSIACDNANDPHISYSASYQDDYEENYMYATKSSGSWTNDFVFDQHWSSFSAIATNLSSDPHICFKDMNTGELIYSFMSGGDWVHKSISNDGNPINGIKLDDDDYVTIAFSEYNSTYKKNVVKHLSSRPEPLKPRISVSPDSIDFWKRVVGNITEPRMVTIRNFGDADLTINNVSINYIIEQDFYITNNPCTTIPSKGICEIAVAFDPLKMGEKIEYLQIESNDPVNPVVRVKLIGEGLEPFAILTGNQQFGEVNIGSVETHEFVISNDGNTGLKIDYIALQYDDTDQFSYDGIPDWPFYIDPGASESFNVNFAPTSTGEKTTRLVIFTSDLDFNNITLSGTGILPSHYLAGSVKAPDESPITEGTVTVYIMNPAVETGTLRWKELEGSSEFSFTNVPDGDITLSILPDRNMYPDLMMAYFGNAETRAEATIINHDHNLSGLNLYALNAPGNAGGGSQVDGLIENTDSPSAYPAWLKSAIATYIEGAAVYLYNQSGVIIAYDVSDANGAFSFKNIPAGTYTFYVDYFGIPMADPSQVEEVVIDADGQVMVIEATIVNGVITATVSESTGLWGGDMNEKFKVYPNPANSIVFIDASMITRDATVQLINSAGQMMWNKNVQGHVNGLRAAIPVSILDNGIYLLQIISSGASYQTKIIIKRK